MQKRLLELDGLRGVAIVMVLGYHLTELIYLNWPSHLGTYAGGRILMTGWLGVYIFFVLSGFLITGILLKNERSKNFWTSFYLKRAFRILPLFLVVFAVVIFLIPPQPRRVLLIYLFFLANWTVLNGMEIRPLTHVWSLAVEEQFYLLWPVVVRNFQVRTLFRVALGLAVLTSGLRIALYLLHVDVWVIYKSTPTSMDGLAMGAALALALKLKEEISFLRRHRKTILFVALGVALVQFIILKLTCYVFDPRAIIPTIPAVTVMTSMTILGIVDRSLKPWAMRLLSQPVLRWFGRRSYGIYLIHEPLKQWALKFATSHPMHSSRMTIVTDLAYTLLVLGVSLALAEISWRYLESVALRLGTRLTHKPEVLLQSA